MISFLLGKIEELVEEIKLLKEENERYKNALQFYGDKSKYGDRGEYWQIVIDGGETARKALKGDIKNESNN